MIEKDIEKLTGIERLQAEFQDIKTKGGLNKIGGSAGILKKANSKEKDYKHWKACFIGPKDTPYENGLYFIEFKLKDDYPASRPLARFRTKIWHPNVNGETGVICLDYIKDKWNKTHTLKESICQIFYLLTQPIFNSALNTKASGSDYIKKAKEYNNKYAYQSQEINWMKDYENNWDKSTI